MEKAVVMHRQVDVLFVKVADLPPALVEQTSGVLVEGEATGHAHRLRGSRVYQTREGRLFLEAVTGSKVVHEEHAPSSWNRDTGR